MTLQERIFDILIENQNTYKGLNEANLHASEEIAELLEQELKSKPATTCVVFALIETDDTYGNKGVWEIFDTKEKADAKLKERCGNNKWCSFIVAELAVK